jgi:hypothetical protein
MKNIIRIEKREKFTVISRNLLEDKRLMWSTRGILAYLLSKPDNWILQISDLKKNGDLGRDAIYCRVNQAIEYGYISRINLRNEKGRMYGVEYIVREKPLKPLPENQQTVLPLPDMPDTANPDNNKYSLKTNTKKPTTTTTTRQNVGCSSLIFHRKLTEIQRVEISGIIQNLNSVLAQNVLDELSGFIDKNLIQKDAVSLAEGLARKAKAGEFKLRLGLTYQESRAKNKSIKKQVKASAAALSKVEGADLDNPLVKKILAIQGGN